MPRVSSDPWTRECVTCGVTFTQAPFVGRPRRDCPACDANGAKRKRLLERQRRWYQRNRVRLADADLRRKVGIGLVDYDAMFLAQEGRCAICRSDWPGGHGRFHVDHDHATGCIRGLLCHRCNTGLGLFRDDARFLEAAVAYLQQGDVSG